MKRDIIFVADENIPMKCIRKLREKGCNVISITEQAKGCDDKTVLDIAKQRNAILITFDKQFGYVIHQTEPDGMSGFILLRIPLLSPDFIFDTLKWLIFDSGILLQGKYIVVNESKVRSFPISND